MKHKISSKPFELPPITLSATDRRIDALAPHLRHIEAALRSLGIVQCRACGTPAARLPLLASLCEDCWRHGDLCGHDFSDIPDHEIGRQYHSLSLFEDLAGNHNPRNGEGHPACRTWEIACGYVRALGAERVLAGVKDHWPTRDCKGIIDPTTLRYERKTGLVPLNWIESEAPRDGIQWRKFWQTYPRVREEIPSEEKNKLLTVR